MEKAIKKAIEGGYVEDINGAWKEWQGDILIDTLFWQALGKAQGWKSYVWTSWKGYSDLYNKEFTDDESWTPKTEYSERHITFVYYWHQFIDHVAEGKNIDNFFNSLIK